MSSNAHASALQGSPQAFSPSFFVDGSLDSAPQLSKAAQDIKGLDNTYHLFSHGKPGELLINEQWLNAHDIVDFLKAKIELSTTPVSSLNIYGCDFAQGDKGLAAVSYIEQALGLSVSASTNVTGVDGDWLLEVGNQHITAFNHYTHNLQILDTGSVQWTHNEDDPSLNFPNGNPRVADGEQGVLTDVTGSMNNIIASVADAMLNPSLVQQNQFFGFGASPNRIPIPAPLNELNVNEYFIDGAFALTLDLARTRGNYIQFAFTTVADFGVNTRVTLDRLSLGEVATFQGGKNFTNYSVGLELSTDGFSGGPVDLLYPNFFRARVNTGYNFIEGSLLDYELAESTTYTFRMYVFGDFGVGTVGDAGLFTDRFGLVTIDDQLFQLTRTFTDECDATASGNDDKDGDNVSDVCDVDDDNDGILDVVEGTSAVSFSAVNRALFNGSTTNGVSMTSTFSTNPVSSNPVDRVNVIDNDNFTFLSGVTFLPNSSLQFIASQVDAFATGTNGNWEMTFSGANVNEVYLHLNSLDQIRVEILAADNPNVGFEVLSSAAASNTPAIAGDINFGADNNTGQDSNLAQEELDGVGGGSADGTIRIYSLTGAPITSLSMRLREQAGNAGLSEGWQFAVELSIDTDGDGIPDYCDLDSDNDGVSDLLESGDTIGIAADANGDGTVTISESIAAVGGTGDVTTNGLMDIFGAADIGTTPQNTDSGTGDLIPDYLDLDSDADGIPDATEARASGLHVPYSGTNSASDFDNDGILNIYDSNIEFGSTSGFFKALTPELNDDDGTGLPDIYDLDSDGDGLLDSAEGGSGVTGLAYTDPDGSVDNPLGTSSLPNVDLDPSDTDFRSFNPIEADLSLTKVIVTPEPYFSGDTVEYTITVTNNGPDAAANVLVEDIPDGLTIVTVSGGTCTAFPCFFPSLANGAVEVITVIGTVQ